MEIYQIESDIQFYFLTCNQLVELFRNFFPILKLNNLNYFSHFQICSFNAQNCQILEIDFNSRAKPFFSTNQISLKIILKFNIL
jgi:hypothetical protein